MNTADWRQKFERIVEEMIVTEADPYQGPLLLALYQTWWDYITSVALLAVIFALF